MKYILIFLFIIFSSITYADDRIKSDDIIVLIVDRNKTLSQKTEELFKTKTVLSGINQQGQQLFVVDINSPKNLKYARSLGITHLPTAVRLRNFDGQWYKYETFDPTKKTYTISNIFRFLGKIMPQPAST